LEPRVPETIASSFAGAASVGTQGGLPLLVVVVNYRTPDLTIDCLRTLAEEAPSIPGIHVVIVDNDSGDGSADAIEAAIRASGWAWAQVVRAERNGGFAYGNNRGIEAGYALGPPRWVLLLNSDTLVPPGALQSCLDAVESDETVGVMSCRLQNADGSMQNTVRRFPTPFRVAIAHTGLPWRWPRLFGWADTEDPGWDRDHEARNVDWVGGAFMMIRGELLERLGGLDEGFFFYGEDTEFCHRIHHAGFKVRYDPRVSITHLGGASSDPTRMNSSARSINYWRGRYLVQRRCYGTLAAATVRAMDRASARIRVAALRLQRRTTSPNYAHETGVLDTLTNKWPKGEQVPRRTVSLRLKSGGKMAPS
jgi:GT2 family glycosyltransferase